MILGCDAAGLDEDGNEVIVHAVISEPGLAGRRDARPQAVAAVRAPPGHVRREGRRAAAQRRPEAGGAVVRRGGLPADRVAHRVPDAVHPVRAAAGRHRAGAGRRRRRRHGADRARRARPGSASAPPAGTRTSGPAPSRSARTRSSSPVSACRAGRRGDGDRRRGDLVALDQVAAAGRHARRLRRHVGSTPHRPS